MIKSILFLGILGTLTCSFGQMSFQKKLVNPSGENAENKGFSLDSHNNMYFLHNTHDGTKPECIVSKYDSLGQNLWNYDVYQWTAGGFTGNLCHSTLDDGLLVMGESNPEVLFKMDANGNFLWSVKIHSIGSTQTTSITEDTDGNIYLCGGGCGTGAIYVRKFDAEGEFKWYKSYMDITGGSGHRIKQIKDGNLIITGPINSSKEMGVIKIDVNGNLIFSRRFHSTLYDGFFPWDFVELPNNNLLIVGQVSDTNNYFHQPFYILTDEYGYPEQYKIINYPDYGEDVFNRAYSVTLDSDNNYHIGVDIGKIGLNISHYIKLDSLFDPIWDKSLSSYSVSSSSRKNNIAQGTNNDLFYCTTQDNSPYIMRQDNDMTALCNDSTEKFVLEDFEFSVETREGEYGLSLGIEAITMQKIAFSWDVIPICQNTGDASIFDFNESHKIVSIFPNPSSGKFNINTTENVGIVVHNSTGKIVHKDVAINGQFELPHVPGLYLVTFLFEDGSYETQKVILE